MSICALGLILLVGSSCSTGWLFNEGQANFDMGMARFNHGDFEGAIPYFQSATLDNPNFGQAYLYLGRSYLSLRRWREAVQPLRTAYRLAPQDTQQEIFNLMMDAVLAAAMDGLLPEGPKPSPERRR